LRPIPSIVQLLYNMVVQEMNVSEFRQKCLTLMDDLPAEGILITRHGHPVAKLMPVRESCGDLIGSVPGLVIDPGDDLFTTGIQWDAES
jgi:antitoxin (DNA-binding transcriptional repressor) of toxin-antitoxin stability system